MPCGRRLRGGGSAGAGGQNTFSGSAPQPQGVLIQRASGCRVGGREHQGPPGRQGGKHRGLRHSVLRGRRDDGQVRPSQGPSRPGPGSTGHRPPHAPGPGPLPPRKVRPSRRSQELESHFRPKGEKWLVPDAAKAPGFGPPGPGSWGLDPVHFPRPVTRYWAETHPGPSWRGQRLREFYGMLIDGLQTAYVNGFAYNRCGRCPRRRSRSASSGRRRCSPGSSGASSCGVGRDVKPASIAATARSRRSTRTRSPTRSWSRTSPLPRPPRGDDHPAHALHRGGDRPDRRLPRARAATGPDSRRPSCSA